MNCKFMFSKHLDKDLAYMYANLENSVHFGVDHKMNTIIQQFGVILQ